MSARLEAVELTTGYAGLAVVRDVSLALQPGRAVALVGPNAAGKSTLVRALTGEVAPLSGRVTLAGRPLAGFSGRDRARRIAVVPQSAREDVEFTVREMVSFGRAAHSGAWGLESARDRAAIEGAMTAADVAHLATRRFGLLSGGERQRVLLARALAQDAPVLLLDEPTAHLDLAHQMLVLELVRSHVQGGGAALVVVHDLALAARLDDVAVLDGGVLVDFGPPSRVLTPARLERTWKIHGALVDTDGGPVFAVRGRAG